MSNLIPPGESILAELGIDKVALKSIDRWKRTQYRAVINWLTKYKSHSDASNLEQLRGLIEAFYHLCGLEAWEKAGKIISIRLNTPTNEELHKQLQTWGYYQQQLKIYQELFKRINQDWDAIYLECQGSDALASGNWQQSIEFYQQQFEISQNLLDKSKPIAALIGLANNLKFLGKSQEATKYYLQILEIAFQSSDQKGKIIALGGLGSILTSLGQYEIAVEYHQQQLNTAKEIGYSLGKADALLNLGHAYHFLKHYQTAIKYQHQSLEIAKKIENREAEAKAFSLLGRSNHELSKYDLAIYFHNNSLEIYRTIGLPIEEAEVLANLAISEMQNVKHSSNLEESILDNLHQALFIFMEKGCQIKEANILKYLAITYEMKGDIDIAKKYLNQALEITTKLKLPLTEECNQLLNKYKEKQFYQTNNSSRFQAIDDNEGDSLTKKINVVIITATSVERKAVLDLLKPYPRRKKILTVFSKSATYYLGQFGAYKTVVTMCRMGSIGENSATKATEQALRKWQPQAIIMVGIAFGKDSNTQNIGDVLVASEIIFYEKQRLSEKDKYYRGPIPPSNSTLLDRFENVHDWNFPNLEGSPCKIIVGSILSGEKLVDDPLFKTKLFNDFPQAIGGEMEGAGLCSASMSENTAWILVKSICDWADGNKNDKNQPLAAEAAASLVHHVLSQKTVLNGIKQPGI